MPGNKFGVGELWDGIKKAVADAWNEVSQKFTGLLKEIGDLVRKNLPAISLILKVVTNLPPLIRSILDLVKRLPKAYGDLLRGAEKNLKAAFNAALKPLPKNIQNGIKSTLKPLFDGLKNSIKGVTKGVQGIPGTIGKAQARIIKEITSLPSKVTKGIVPKITEATKPILKAVGDRAKDLLKGFKDVGKGLSKEVTTAAKRAEKLIGESKKAIDLANKEAKNFTTSLKNFDKAFAKGMAATVQPLNLVVKEVKAIPQSIAKAATSIPKAVETTVNAKVQAATKEFGSALKRFDKAAEAITGAKLPDLASLPKKAADEVGKAVGPRLKELERPIASVAKEAVAASRAAGDAAKVASEILPLIKTMFKIAVNAIPIIDGFADYMQFEELNLKLDNLLRRQESQTEALLTLGISAKTILSKLEKLQAGGSGGDNKELLASIRSELNGLATKLAPSSPAASAAAIAQEVVSRIPANNPAGAEAIAQAVAAKLPTGASAESIAQAVAAKLPTGASAESIAQAVAAKLPEGAKASTAAEIAAAVKAKLDPSFQAIDKKLPDNGIYRVDQAGIATAVKAKLDPSLQAIDKKLPDNGLFPVDKAGIANTTKATLDPKLTSIESKLAQPTNSNQLQPIQQQIAGLGQQITNLTQQTTNNFNNSTSNSFSSQQRDYLNQQFGALAQINRGTAASLSAQLQAIPGQVNVPKVDLAPVLTAVGEVGAAVGAPQLKKGIPVSPNADFVKLGQQLNNGVGSTTISNLPQMMMALAAVPYVRQGLHRLGGDYDRSVMNPGLGKTKITDSLGFQKWTFDQIDERLGMPTPHTIKGLDGQLQKKTFRSLQDTIEETNSSTVVALQDLEVVERYNFAIAQDIQKLMQIVLQTREDVDLLIDDAGCKFRETKRSHPTHLNLKSPDKQGSLESLFQQGSVHYVARVWDDSADKNQKMEKIAYDTQIAAMSNKFEWDKVAPDLPLDKSRANSKKQGDEIWKTFVSTVTEPPEGYVSKGNPIPEIKTIEKGSPKVITKPTIPTKKLGQ
jgi:hypothetical protein